jgi:transposase
VLYDVTSTYREDRCRPPARFGHSRDHCGGRPQMVIGLLCSFDGRLVAAEVFEGNTGDPTTAPKQIETLKQRFNLKRVVFVGDRSMVTDQHDASVACRQVII